MGEKEYRTILGENETRLPADISKKKSKFFLFAVFFAGALLSLFIYTLTTVPANFTPGTYVEIPEGYTLQSIGKLLKEKSIIRSSVMFNLLVLKEGKEKNIPAGTYLFKDRDAVFTVAMRMANGEHGIEVHKITLPEGMTRKEMADILVRELPQFDSELFRNETAGEEGYLFPDTYFFYSNATSGAVKEALVDNFVKKTGRLKSESLLNESDWKNIIVMASLIEGEAATPLDRRII